MPSSHLILCHPLSSCPQSLPASESFLMSQLFTWGGQSIGVSALASVLLKKSQDWSPSEWTGWISLQAKGLSTVFSNTTVQKHVHTLMDIHTHTHTHMQCTYTVHTRTHLHTHDSCVYMYEYMVIHVCSGMQHGYMHVRTYNLSVHVGAQSYTYAYAIIHTHTRAHTYM